MPRNFSDLVTANGIFDRCFAVVLVDMRLVGEICLLESDARFLGCVPAHVVHYARAGSGAVEQIFNGSGNSERGLVEHAQ